MYHFTHVFLVLILLSQMTTSSADNHIYLDADNNYAGSVDEDGTIRDAEGNYQGKFKSDELEPYVDKGKFGTGFEGGHAFDRSGTYSGKVDRFGHAYDKSGSYSGRIDSFGNVYDRAGNYSGKVTPRP